MPQKALQHCLFPKIYTSEVYKREVDYVAIFAEQILLTKFYSYARQDI